MSKNTVQDFIYLEKEDYDRKVQINGDEVKGYSKKKLKALFPNKDYTVLGETSERRKKDNNRDVGRIELAEKRLFVGKHGEHNKVFRKESTYFEVEGGGFIAYLKVRLLPIILIIGLLLGALGFGAYALFFADAPDKPIDPVEEDPHIVPIETDLVTVSGIILMDEKPIENASVTLAQNKRIIASTTTDKDGKYILVQVATGVYSLTIAYDNHEISEAVVVGKQPVVHHIDFPSSDLTVKVVLADDTTPAIGVNGLTKEAGYFAKDDKRVEVTLLATRLTEDMVPTADKTLIEELSGETRLTYFDFSIFYEIFNQANISEGKNGIYVTEQPLEIIIPYDSTHDVGTYVFRCHEGEALKFTELTARPTEHFEDGTYYVAADYVIIYTKYFCTYAIGSASVSKPIKGNDVITYSDKAYVNLRTNRIDMQYEHDGDSSNDARVEIYLVGTDGNLLISTSGIIPPGNQLKIMQLLENVQNKLSTGTFQGLMKIYYLDQAGGFSTSVEIPLTVAITKQK